jgi:hypothetical protein
VVFQHVQASKRGPEAGLDYAAPSTAEAPAGDLASFARSIGPIKMPQRR